MATTTHAPETATPPGDGEVRPSPEQRAAVGKAARAEAPLESHAEFRPAKSRDPGGIAAEPGRDPRTGAGADPPWPDARVAVHVLPRRGARDGRRPRDDADAGLRTQLCGDAHLSNFGAYASPERRLVFDINDFDETLPGPFEWDVKRLAASFVVAGREDGLPKEAMPQDHAAGGGELPHGDARVRRTADPRRLVRLPQHRRRPGRAQVEPERSQAEEGKADIKAPRPRSRRRTAATACRRPQSSPP